MIDGTGAAPIKDVRIVIEHGLIVEVGDADTTAVEIDARTSVLTPGLVATTVQPLSDAELRGLLARGVTTIEMVATDVRSLAAARDRIGVGRHRGPRVVVGALLAEADSVQEMRNAVRKAAELSAEAVHLSRGDGVEEALCAFVDEAHAQDMQAMIAVDNAAALEAVRDCAAATVVWKAPHAPHLDPEPLRESADVVVDVNAGLPSAREWQAVSGLTGLAYDAHLLTASAYSALIARPVAAGLTREATVRALTHGPAGALGLGDALGKIAKGYRADFVVSAADGTVQYVFIDGIEQRLGAPSFRDKLIEWFD